MYERPFRICRLSISCASERHVQHSWRRRRRLWSRVNFVAVHSSWLTHRDPEIHQLLNVTWQSWAFAPS